MYISNPLCSQNLLVFPGGAAEANKTADEKYSPVWRERYGFVRMAAQNGYNITPFGLVADMLLLRAQNKHKEGAIRRFLTR